MPMRVGDTPEGGAPESAPVEAAPPGGPLPEGPEEAKKKKKGDDGALDDAVEAAGWGCAIFSCFDCLSVLAISAATAAVVVQRSRHNRRLAEEA